MNKFTYAIIITIFVFSQPIQAAIITPTLNISTPLLITTGSDFNIDFGVPGNNITLENLSLTLNFTQNVIDPGESIHFIYPVGSFGSY